MKTLYILDKFGKKIVGGAQRSLLHLVSDLPNSYKIVWVVSKDAYSPELYAGEEVKLISTVSVKFFPYISYLFERLAVKGFVKKIPEDAILITQGMWGNAAARFFSGKSVLFFRDQYQYGDIPLLGSTFGKIFKKINHLFQFGGIYMIRKDAKAAISTSTVIANSQFVHDELEKRFDLSASILFPCIDVEAKRKIHKKRTYITLVGDDAIKGTATFWEIAKRLPKEQFRIISKKTVIPFKKGVMQYEPWTSSIDEMYATSTMVLVPSLCNEAFGRVAVEAQLAGVPVIASNKGGLPECVDARFIVQGPKNIEEWISKIALAKKSYTFVDLAPFSCGIQHKKFANLIKKL